VKIILMWLSLGATLFLPSPEQRTIQADAAIVLAIRIFDGTAEVTAETRVHVYPAGTRGEPLAADFLEDRGHQVPVTPGIYDVQAVQQREGEVVNIRWAERLVVMRYPDEAGEHLEVINFQPGFGALQVLPPPESPPSQNGWQVTAFPVGAQAPDPITPVASEDYYLFVVPGGDYDLLARGGSAPVWLTDIEVPPDHTRLKHLPTPAR
jgi:hypothetical protein